MGRLGSVLAVDVGATTIKGARVSALGDYQQVCSVPTYTGNAAVAGLLHVCDTLLTTDCIGVSLAVAGNLDPRAGIVLYAANIGWRQLGLRDLVAERFHLPVTVLHDVQAACLAEKAVGLGRATPNLLVVVIGTGIAAGIVANGQLLAGATGSAGELGHMVVRPDGDWCSCGQRGCLEVYASAAGIARRHTALGGTSALSAAEVGLSSTVAARTAWNDATQSLGQALAGATVLIDPELIVLAGGVSHAGSRLTVPVQDSLRAHLTWREAPKLELSPLGSRGGLVGAAIAGWRTAGFSHVFREWSSQQMNPREAT